MSDGVVVRRYDANDVYVEGGNWNVDPTLGDFPRVTFMAAHNDGTILGRRANAVSVFMPDGRYLSQFAPGYGSVTSFDGLVFASFRFFDVFGNDLGKLPEPFNVEPSAQFGPDGALYVCSGLVHKFRRAYRTVSTLVGGGAVPLAQVFSVALRDGTTLVDIDYRVHDTDSASATTAALALVGGTYSLSAAQRIVTLVEGTATRLGSGISTNQTHRLTWDSAADLPGGEPFVQAKILILANDGRGLLDRHYVTLPAGVPNAGDPELMISDTPITDADFLNVWLWLLATGDPDVAQSGSDLVKVGGADGGAILASGTTTTAAGRAYLFARFSVREATAVEADRARAGTTPGVQQYEPLRRVGSRPVKINEVGFDSGATAGYWVVPL